MADPNKATEATGQNYPASRLGFVKSYIPPAALPFLIGGSSGIIATICIQPIDMVKVRLQLTAASSTSGKKPTALSTARGIIAQGRVLDLYSGLSAALLRQVVYGTARLGLFFTFENKLKAYAQLHNRQVTFSERALASLAAGGLGAIIGNPAEVALIRMQSDGLRPKLERANYRSAFDTLFRITKQEGIATLWSGATPTVVRAMAVNFGQLAFFSESKHQLSKIESLSEQTRTMGAASIAGFFAAFFSLPFDLVKTRLQQQTKAKDGSLPYLGVRDCAVKIAKQEGLAYFYRGFWTYFMRLAPHT